MSRTNNAYTDTKNSLPQSIRFQSVGLLNRNLASAIDLERQAKQAKSSIRFVMYALAIGQASLTERTVTAGREVLLGRRRGPLAILPFAGPSAVASIAYTDPGEKGDASGLERTWRDRSESVGRGSTTSPPRSAMGDACRPRQPSGNAG
jgi:hypothetical protein